MKRPDLDSTYSGWQVIDSTPQEMSDSNCAYFPFRMFNRYIQHLEYEFLPNGMVHAQCNTNTFLDHATMYLFSLSLRVILLFFSSNIL